MSGHVEEFMVQEIMRQLIEAVKYLHSMKICHRDIKCANIFLTKNNEVKLGDLNVSKVSKGSML